LPFALANGKACGECLHWPEANAAALPFAKANGKSLCHVEFKPSTLLFAIRFSEWQGLWRMRRIRHA
jgi:hypothetical protein